MATTQVSTPTTASLTDVGIATGLLVLAIAARLLTWILLNGANPIHFTAPVA